MNLPDVNVVLAAFRPDHPHHDVARSWIEKARGGREPLGLPTVVAASVVRLATNPRVFARPDTTAAILDYLDVLLEPPGLLLQEDASHWSAFSTLCRTLGLRGNDVPDAQLAAVALAQRAELVTLDRGFARFPRLRWRCLLDG